MLITSVQTSWQLETYEAKFFFKFKHKMIINWILTYQIGDEMPSKIDAALVVKHTAEKTILNPMLPINPLTK